MMRFYNYKTLRAATSKIFTHRTFGTCLSRATSTAQTQAVARAKYLRASKNCVIWLSKTFSTMFQKTRVMNLIEFIKRSHAIVLINT
jgi:hypothetical protein